MNAPDFPASPLRPAASGLPSPKPAPNGFRIRILSPVDQPKVMELLEAGGLYTESVTLESGPDYRVRYGLGEVVNAEQPDEPKVVGVMGLEQMPAADGVTLMRSFTLREAWRGRGLSGHFIAWAETEARALGHRELLLFTEQTEDIAAYWQRQGFTQIDPATVPPLAPMLPQVRHMIEEGWLTDAFAFRRELEY